VLSDRERRALDDIERGLLSDDPTRAQRFGAGHAALSSSGTTDLATEGYAVLAVISGVLAVFLVNRWPVLSALLLATAVLNWRIGMGATRLLGLRHGTTPPPP